MESVSEEIAVLASEAVFQDISEDNLVELSNEELAHLDRQTHKEAQDDMMMSVVSEENSTTVEGV